MHGLALLTELALENRQLKKQLQESDHSSSCQGTCTCMMCIVECCACALCYASTCMTVIVIVVSVPISFMYFFCHFHLKGPVQAQPLDIASATSAAGQ